MKLKKITSRLPIKARIMYRIRRIFSPQVTLVRKKGGLNWVILTRTLRFGKWEIKETIKNRDTKKAVQYVIAQYKGHLLWVETSAYVKMKLSKRKA